jgi:hypothetical protein
MAAQLPEQGDSTAAQESGLSSGMSPRLAQLDNRVEQESCLSPFVSPGSLQATVGRKPANGNRCSQVP